MNLKLRNDSLSIENLEELIRKDQIEKAMRECLDSIDDDDVKNQMNLLAGRLSEANRSLSIGTISREDYLTVRNSIRAGLLETIGGQKGSTSGHDKKVWLSIILLLVGFFLSISLAIHFLQKNSDIIGINGDSNSGNEVIIKK